MALTQFSGSLLWLQLCGLAAALCDGVVPAYVQAAFHRDLVYQPTRLRARWTTTARVAAHVIPYEEDGARWVCRGYPENAGSFRWAGSCGISAILQVTKRSRDCWSVEYFGDPETKYHRLALAACSEPCEPAATATARSARS